MGSSPPHTLLGQKDATLHPALGGIHIFVPADSDTIKRNGGKCIKFAGVTVVKSHSKAFHIKPDRLQVNKAEASYTCQSRLKVKPEWRREPSAH